nr:PREDICTED: uncharacterized protein LOC109037658 [Bemisia tabaci]
MQNSGLLLKSLALLPLICTIEFRTLRVSAARGTPSIAPAFERGSGDYRPTFIQTLHNVRNNDECKRLGYWPGSRAIARARIPCDRARIALNRLNVSGVSSCHEAACLPKHKFGLPSAPPFCRWSWGCAFYCDPVTGRETFEKNGRQVSIFRLSEIQIPLQ